MVEFKMEDTITIGTLWAMFRKIKLVPYNSSIDIRSSFKASPEMLYNSFQKELNAQARISMN